MAELIEFFVGSMPERLASLTDSWRRREFESLRRLAHQLKGASGGYGFPQVGAAAERLERELNEVEPARFETIRAEFEELINLCRRVVA